MVDLDLADRLVALKVSRLMFKYRKRTRLW